MRLCGFVAAAVAGLLCSAATVVAAEQEQCRVLNADGADTALQVGGCWVK